MAALFIGFISESFRRTMTEAFSKFKDKKLHDKKVQKNTN